MKQYNALVVFAALVLAGVTRWTRQPHPMTNSGPGTLGSSSQSTRVIADPTFRFGPPTTGLDAHSTVRGQGWILQGIAAGDGSWGYGIGAGSTVVGQARRDGRAFAFLFENSTIRGLGASAVGSSSLASGINSSGQVVGTAETPSSVGHAFFYTGGTLLDLGTLGGGSSEAYAINAAGHVAGASYTRGDRAEHAFVVRDGAMEDLGTLGGDESRGCAINDSDEVADSSAIAGGAACHAFLCSDGKLRDLGTLGGVSSHANAINRFGAVAGWAETLSGARHAFLWADGDMRDLGTLGGASSEACGINAATWIVGQSKTAGGANHAFLVTRTMKDLNALFPPTSGWELVEARAINDGGQIAGSGLFRGHRYAFLLTPVGEKDDSAAQGMAATPHVVARPRAGRTLNPS